MREIDKDLLKSNGWVIECESPLEIRNDDGSFVTLNAVDMIIFYLRFNPDDDE